jgi:tetratricopeptide (TPR) repeat protein
VYIAAKIPVGDQLRFDVYMHFETESPVNFLSRTASPEAAREAMNKAEQEGDWETVVTQAKVLLSLLDNADAAVVLTLAKAHEQLSQYAMAIKAADMILAPGSSLSSDEKSLREAYTIKCNCLRVRGFFDECLAISKEGLAKFPDDKQLLSARKASEGVAENEATNPHRWDKADKAALNLPFGEYTVPELAKSLTETLTTDADKIRAIYRWICENIEYDVENLRYGSAEAETTPESVLDSRMAICEGYSKLFVAMCEVVHCEAVCITGWARSGLVNMAALKVPNHMWNAFKLDGSWYLADLTWSAGSINPDFTFKQEFNGFYWMTDSDHFANSHYAEDTQWLLVPEFPKETFATTLYLTSHMYRLGIKTKSHTDAVIQAKEGEIVRIDLAQGPETDRVYLHPQAKVWGGVQPVAWDTHAVWDAKTRTHTVVVDTSGSRGAVNLSVFYSTEEVGTYTTLLAYKMVVKS